LGILLFLAGLELILSIQNVNFKQKNDIFNMFFVVVRIIGVSRCDFIITLIEGTAHLCKPEKIVKAFK